MFFVYVGFWQILSFNVVLYVHAAQEIRYGKVWNQKQLREIIRGKERQMDRVMLYEQFFKEKDYQKPYQSLNAYLQDLFHMLDGYIQTAFALQDEKAGQIGNLVADICRMEEQIENRKQKSHNRLLQIERRFHITAFERFQLLMALSVEYHPVYESYYGSMRQNAGMIYPTKGLAVSLYGFVHEMAAGEKECLLWDDNKVIRYFFRSGQNAKRFTDILILEEGFAKYILGFEEHYRILADTITIEDPDQAAPVSVIHTDVLEKLLNVWGQNEIHRIMFQIYGAEGIGKKHIVKGFSQKIKQRILFCSMDFLYLFSEKESMLSKKDSMLSKSESLDILCKIYANVLVMDAVPCFIFRGQPEDPGQTAVMQAILAEAEKSFGFSIVLTGENHAELFARCRSYIRIEVPPLNAGTRLALWKEFSDQAVYEEDVDLSVLVNKHDGNVGEIKDIIRTAKLYAAAQGKAAMGNWELSQSFRVRQRGHLSSLAVRLNAAFTWDDLIIDNHLKEQLLQICNQIIYKDMVEEQWGFQEKLAYGKGISALFYGPPGTGKTMAAQVMANELGLELFRIDISQIHSKYIGETEKNISELFYNAKNMNAILFFDEADALFAKRSEVKNSNDRNANSVTAHLLQKLEEYEGISILATNLSGSIDDAFKRRIKFMVQFEYPEAPLRLKLFQTILPKKAECGEYLDLEYYAEHFEMTGSNIKEVLVNAAFLAASKGQGIKNGHVVEAIRQNYLKYGKLLTDDDFGYLI